MLLLIVVGTGCKDPTPDQAETNAIADGRWAYVVENTANNDFTEGWKPAYIDGFLEKMDWEVKSTGTSEGLLEVVKTKRKYFLLHVHSHGSPTAMADTDDTEGKELPALYNMWKFADVTVPEKHKYMFVFLQGCSTSASGDAMKALLVATGAEAIVGPQQSLSGNFSSFWTEGFYSNCVGGTPIGTARERTSLVIKPGPNDLMTPVNWIITGNPDLVIDLSHVKKMD